MDSNILNFQFQREAPTLIKVVGVGGGGGNAVTHMYNKGIDKVSFALCNTDNQALFSSPIPTKIQLGKITTEGLGAGNSPVIARKAAIESTEEIHQLLDDGTKMVFITAGMGGGTGTGASPVVAKIAQEMGILTVGIVTIPFALEGEPKILQAFDGIEELSKYVDALLVVNNEKLVELFSHFKLSDGFKEADDTLATAAKGISEIITKPGYINLDFADVKKTLKNGGIALMSSGYGQGEQRTSKAFEDAFNSPLLYNNDIFNASKLLINISMSHENEVTMEEIKEVRNFVQKFGYEYELIWGTSYDDSLADRVKVVILATGYSVSDIPGFDNFREKREQSAVDAEERQRLKEKRESRRNTIDRIYGLGALTGLSRVNFNPIILTDEQLDDEKLIEWLTQNPSFKRDKTESLRIIECGNLNESKESLSIDNQEEKEDDSNREKTANTIMF